MRKYRQAKQLNNKVVRIRLYPAMVILLEEVSQVDNVFSSASAVRKKLESTFQLNPDYYSINQQLSEIARLTAMANMARDTSMKFQLFYKIADLARQFANTYQESITPELYSQIEYFADEAVGKAKINHASFYMIGNVLEREGEQSYRPLILDIKDFYTGARLLAAAVENYWVTFSDKTRESIKKAFQTLIQIESKAELQGEGDGSSFATHKELLRQAAGYGLWIIKQFEEKNYLLSSVLKHKGDTQEEQIEYNKPFIEFLESRLREMEVEWNENA